MHNVYGGILDTIGNTPLVKINQLVPAGGAEVFAKIEGVNPGGSIKDRVALKMIDTATKSGDLTKGKIIIEATSGNTGIALAMIGAVRGYEVLIVMSEAVSVERRKTIEAFGAKILLTEAALGTDGAIIKVKEMATADPEKYYCPDQFSNMANKQAHYETTAEEIWQQTGGRLDYLVATVGTSGTIMGLAENLKAKDSKIKIVCAKPTRGHYIQGLKNMEEAIVPAIYDESLIDEFIVVESEDAFASARDLIHAEGIFAGMSSGAAIWASLELAKKVGSGRIVTIFPDRGEKYLSTSLFN
jgi:S-sulfo-L-cysteine synthase (O-acetyl-L-serine-dependent)